MKALVGAAIGTFALGVVLLASGVIATSSRGSIGTSPAFGLSDQGAVIVSCDAGQRAVVRPARAGDNSVSRVDCLTADGMGTTDSLSSGYVSSEPLTTGAVGDARLVRASYPTTMIREEQPVRRTVSRPTVRRTRTWQKSAMIIGGTAGAGAGIGAIVGGKKGALLGAAIGGGAATVYDQMTRRRVNE
jgi:hypothetical protein